jgi:hypothetical protein
MPCKNTIKWKEVQTSSLNSLGALWDTKEHHLDRETIFLSEFWTTFWENMDTNLKRSRTFHPQNNG